MCEPDPTTLATLTSRLANLTRRAMGERMARERWAIDAGFRPGCVGVLQVVAAGEPVSQREVSDRLLLDPSRDPADRRRYGLEVTEAGRKAAARLQQVTREAQEAVLAPLDDGERAALASLIGRIVAHHDGGEPVGATRLDPDQLSPSAAGPAPRSAGS